MIDCHDFAAKLDALHERADYAALLGYEEKRGDAVARYCTVSAATIANWRNGVEVTGRPPGRIRSVDLDKLTDLTLLVLGQGGDRDRIRQIWMDGGAAQFRTLFAPPRAERLIRLLETRAQDLVVTLHDTPPGGANSFDWTIAGGACPAGRRVPYGSFLHLEVEAAPGRHLVVFAEGPAGRTWLVPDETGHDGRVRSGEVRVPVDGRSWRMEIAPGRYEMTVIEMTTAAPWRRPIGAPLFAIPEEAEDALFAILSDERDSTHWRWGTVAFVLEEPETPR